MKNKKLLRTLQERPLYSHQADAIDELLQMKPQLRVTYIDEAEGVFYSVLIKWDAIEKKYF